MPFKGYKLLFILSSKVKNEINNVIVTGSGQSKSRGRVCKKYKQEVWPIYILDIELEIFFFFITGKLVKKQKH